jgi:hypothetical protein
MVASAVVKRRSYQRTEVSMAEVTGGAGQALAPDRSHRVRIARRYVAGFSALGVAAGLVLTGAASGSAAPAATGAPARIITLTGSTSSSAGQLKITLKYELVGRNEIKPLSLSYSGGSKLSFKNPAVIFSLQPIAVPPGQVRITRLRPFGLFIIRQIHDLGDFSGTIPARDLPKISWKFVKRARQVAVGPGALLQANVGSVRRAKKQVNISAISGDQVGILVGPGAL